METSPPRPAPMELPAHQSTHDLSASESSSQYSAGVDYKLQQNDQTPSFKHSWRVWCIFLTLCLLSFISAVDATIVTTSLPTITREVGGRQQYAWIANSYLFASTAPQPLIGQIANIFGRRNPTLVAITLFALGSGLAGGANSSGMLIAARTVQGLGTAGLYVLSDIIICDLIPPRHRAPYLSAVLGTAALGTTVGPILGGALAQVEWRWIFWLNVPVSGLGFLAIVFTLKVRYTRSLTWKLSLARVDYLGNAIFIPSMIAIFFGLIMGGVKYPWESWHIIVPLVLGVVGWIGFHLHQASAICKEPSTPPRLFKHQTSIIGFIIIFLCAVILQAINYFLPVYFQAVKQTSPLTSGIYFLPFALAIMPIGVATGAFMSKTGRYIPLHLLGFALIAIGTGLLSVLNESSSTAAWVCFQIIASAGVGIIFTATLPSTLAPLREEDVAVATGTYSFVRSFGLVWGVTLASIVFNGQIDAHITSIDDGVQHLLANGAAYSYASGGLIPQLPPQIKNEVIGACVEALKVVWELMAAISCLGFCCVFLQKHVELRKDHTSEYGLEESRQEAVDAELAHETGQESK